MVWVLVGVRGCVLRPIGHDSVTLFSLFVSIKDRSLHEASWASHRFIVPSAYLGMGAWKTCCSLVADLALSGPTDGKRRWWRSLTALSPGLRGGGLESKFGRGPGHLG